MPNYLTVPQQAAPDLVLTGEQSNPHLTNEVLARADAIQQWVYQQFDRLCATFGSIVRISSYIRPDDNGHLLILAEASHHELQPEVDEIVSFAKRASRGGCVQSLNDLYANYLLRGEHYALAG